MHRRPLLILLPALVAAGCSSAVKVAPLAGGDTPVCRAVAAAWPASVAGEQPRVTAVQDVTVAAWGDPPIIARCGATAPGPTTEQCLDIDGVDWVTSELDDGVKFTTYGREPAIEVFVPDAYAPQPLVMPAFGAAAREVPKGERECS